MVDPFLRGLLLSCGETDDQAQVIGLLLCLVCRAVAVDFSAFGATVVDDVSLFGIGLGADRLHCALAGVGTVAGKHVHVKRPQAEGAVVAGAVAEGLDGQAAVFTNKSIVVFCESFLFHSISPFI